MPRDWVINAAFHWYCYAFLPEFIGLHWLYWCALACIGLHEFVGLHLLALVFIGYIGLHQFAIDLRRFASVCIGLHWFASCSHWVASVFISLHWFAFSFHDLCWVPLKSVVFTIEVHWLCFDVCEFHCFSLKVIEFNWFSCISSWFGTAWRDNARHRMAPDGIGWHGSPPPYRKNRSWRSQSSKTWWFDHRAWRPGGMLGRTMMMRMRMRMLMMDDRYWFIKFSHARALESSADFFRTLLQQISALKV